MTFMDAVKKPFQDIKTLIIGMIIMIIPIVNFTIGFGYFLECAKAGLKNQKKMPEWKNWGNLFVKGIGALVIGLIYSIPVFILLGITIGSAILTGGFSALLSGEGIAAINTLATLGVGMIITFIVALLMSLVSTAALIRYAEKGRFGAAFELSIIAKKAFTGTYFAAWLISMIYAVIVVLILSFIPILGTSIGAFIAGVTIYTFLAEAYKKA